VGNRRSFFLGSLEWSAKNLLDGKEENAVMENGMKQCYIVKTFTPGYNG
jgi:hypothetical protein